MKSNASRRSAKILVVFLSVMITVAFSFQGPMWSYGATNGGVVSAEKVDLMVSLSDDTKDAEVSIPVQGLDKAALEQAITDNNVTLSLTRDKSKKYLDADMFPHQKDGGELSTWKTQNDTPLFDVTGMEAVESNGKISLKVTIDSHCYFYSRGKVDYSAPHTGGGAYLDICGYFNLTANVDGSSIGNVSAKVTPYPSFHTMDEVYADIDAIAAYDTDRYVEKASMGKSTAGRDMPYLIIAKDKKTVSDWLEYCDLVETDPEAAKAKIDEVKAPVMYSNVHSNEIAAVDGIIDFAWKLVKEDTISYKYLDGFKHAGEDQLDDEMGEKGAKGSVAVPDLMKDKATYLGFLRDGNSASGKVDLNKFYKVSNQSYDVDKILDDIFFIIVPEENVDGRAQDTREAANGYDLNRDNSFQTTPETANMQKLIGTFNPVSLTEFHGRVTAFQCEPCDPPHEPNFEYDLLSEHLIQGGEALGIGAVANNKAYNSYVIPQRDYLEYTGKGEETYWSDPWDDMSTSYTPQFAMLHGVVAYTVELPAYSEDGVQLASYAILGNSAYVAKEKAGYLECQADIYKRGVNNENSDAYDKVGQWLADQHDVEGAEMDLFRPEYKGEGENGNFYPEAYIIPLDRENQKNLQAACDMLLWLTRNDVKVSLTEKEITIGGVDYPRGTAVVSMHQAKRSVANGVLNSGTLINSWTVLYSEGITAFDKTRGFDMAVTAKPSDYQTIQSGMESPMDYESAQEFVKGQSSVFDGTSGKEVIIKNVSEDSTSAVNALLKKGKVVAMITEGENKGDFVTSYENYRTIAKKYRLTVTGVDVYEENITSKEITKLPKVYVVGRRADATAGFVGTNRVTSGAYVYNYDSAALKLMNFEQVADPAKADVIMGGNAIRNDSAAIDAVKAGTPYITYTSNSASNVGNFVSGTKRAGLSGAMDCLAFVEYPEETMVNASYINENDTIMYGYNAGSFTSVPKGAKVLVTVKNETPLEGFVPTLTEPAKAAFDKYLDGGILGFEYTGDDLDIAAFSQTLTNKIHQRDEFQFISNFIFSRMLGDEYDGAANDTTNETIAALEQQLEEAKRTGSEQVAALEKQLEEARKGNTDQIQALIDKLEAAEAKVADLEKKNADKEAREAAEKEAAKAKSDLVKAQTAAAQKLTVTGLKAKSKKKKVTVSWAKTKGAAGYQIRFAKKGKKFKTLAVTTKVSVKTKKLKKKAKYRFQVRTYSVVNGKKVYGKWVGTKYVKVK